MHFRAGDEVLWRKPYSSYWALHDPNYNRLVPAEVISIEDVAGRIYANIKFFCSTQKRILFIGVPTKYLTLRNLESEAEPEPTVRILRRSCRD